MLGETPREQSVRWPEGQPKDVEGRRRICMETMGSAGMHFFFKPSLLEKTGSHLLYLGDRREEEKKGGKGRRRERRRGKRRRGRGEERRVTPGES